jgi:uncharacterized membrane protein YbhN (UPF0104 family)
VTEARARRSPKRKLARVLLRSILGLGLLAAVVLWLDPAEILASLLTVRRGPLVLAFLIQVLARLIWTYRWQAILRASQLERGFWDLFAVLHIGLFFNTFLPSSVGGDVVRGYYASRGGKDQVVVSYLSVVIERILGLATFAAMAAIAAGFAFATGSTPLPDRLLLSVVALGAALVLGATTLFWWHGWVDLARRLPVPDRWIDDLRRGLELFRRPGTPRLAILSCSVALKLIAILLYILCGHALGLDLAPTVYFLVVPAATVAAMLPVTLNGLGVRESVMAGLFSMFGAPRATAGAIALLGLAVITSFALIGGLFYVFYRLPDSGAA